MRITTSMVQRNVLSDLNHLSSQLAKTQAKAASNRELTRPSDNPYATSEAMGLRAGVGATEQFVRNIDDATGWMDSTESAMDSMTLYVHRAHELLQQGATGTTDPQSRKGIAAELDEVIQGLKETANMSYAGKYILAGTNTSVPPYTLGTTDTYAGDGNQILREIGPGVDMPINSVASDLLGDGADNKLLATLREISQKLKDNDGPGLRAGLATTLDAHLDTLLEMRGRNGAKTNRLESARTRLDQLSGALTEQLSKTEDADIAKTLIDFNSQSAAYQAALKAGANIVQSSLMDFLR